MARVDAHRPHLPLLPVHRRRRDPLLLLAPSRRGRGPGPAVPARGAALAHPDRARTRDAGDSRLRCVRHAPVRRAAADRPRLLRGGGALPVGVRARAVDRVGGAPPRLLGSRRGGPVSGRKPRSPARPAHHGRPPVAGDVGSGGTPLHAAGDRDVSARDLLRRVAAVGSLRRRDLARNVDRRRVARRARVPVGRGLPDQQEPVVEFLRPLRGGNGAPPVRSVSCTGWST